MPVHAAIREDTTMAIGRKLIGGALGLILGGPIGAILGAVTGHQVDRLRRDAPKGRALRKPRFRLTRNEESEILFVTSLTILAAKLS
ncbi:MAG: hypothetical protein OXB95_08850, partial [Rhodobacteraceae bacterium]|nr:hypothetical protein [Paracoccaceae bacterium]